MSASERGHPPDLLEDKTGNCHLRTDLFTVSSRQRTTGRTNQKRPPFLFSRHLDNRQKHTTTLDLNTMTLPCLLLIMPLLQSFATRFFVRLVSQREGSLLKCMCSSDALVSKPFYDFHIDWNFYVVVLHTLWLSSLSHFKFFGAHICDGLNEGVCC